MKLILTVGVYKRNKEVDVIFVGNKHAAVNDSDIEKVLELIEKYAYKEGYKFKLSIFVDDVVYSFDEVLRPTTLAVRVEGILNHWKTL